MRASAVARISGGRVSAGLVWVVIAGTAAVTALPFAWMVAMSLKSYAQTIAIPPDWLPIPWHLANYAQVFSYMPFAHMYFNSALVACTQTALVLFVASLGAYAFARMRFFGHHLLFLLFLGTTAVPGWVTLIPLYLIMRDIDWINTYQGLIVPGAISGGSVAFAIFLLRQFFLTIPQELEEAAILDGASPWQIYWRVVLPLAVPALSALGVLTFMGSWNNLLWPLIMVQSQSLQTIPLGLSQLAVTHGWVNIQWGPLMAGTTMGVLPLLAVFVFLQGRVVRGITLTGMR
jgi:multiple sugar transport system permease protein